jgi:Sulfatase
VSTDASWDARRAGARGRGVRGGVHRATHLLALSAFAFAQPLFAKLGPAPGYFAAHGMTSTEVVLFAVVLVVVPALVLIALEGVARIFSRRVRWIVHLLFVAALVALIVLPPVGGLPTAIAYAVAGVAGVGFAVAYARWRGVRAFTTVLGVAPLASLAAFLFVSPTAKFVSGDQLDAWRADGSFRPPIVFVQLDALPGLLLETPEHRVDAVRFPSFARLAHDGVWYRDASSVHENAAVAVPSFVDGRLPRKGTLPGVQDHEPNLFTLLGPDYRMNVSEEVTSLCPYEFCLRTIPAGGSIWKDTRVVFEQIVRPADARASLPSISQRWTRFDEGPLQTRFRTRKKTPAEVTRRRRSGRLTRFESWLNAVGHGGARPELDYIHVLLPAAPREFVPDGQRYVTPDGALGGPGASDNRFLSEQQEQRAILQVGFADRLVGRVIARLQRLGIYDEAMVVVTADHGESFVAPKAVTRDNIADIGSIPLFIKYPKGHGPSGIDDRYVRSVDVFPTIAHALGLALPALDGRALQDPHYHGHGSVRVATTNDRVVRTSARRWARERRLSLGRRLRLFGSGARSVYAFGPHRALVGRPVTDFEIFPATTPQATIVGAKRFANVDPIAPVCLCQIGGQIGGTASGGVSPVTGVGATGGAVAPNVTATPSPAVAATPVPAVVADASGMPLAIALNGRIVATAEGFAPRGAKKLNWSAMIPPRAYHDGRNTLELFRIAGRRRLERIGSAP